MDTVLLEVENRLEKMFAGLAAGGDVAPTLRLRTEGLMEAVVLAGIADEAHVDSLLAGRYQLAFGTDIESDFGEDWRQFYPFPQIPAVGRRAPVYPSTKE